MHFLLVYKFSYDILNIDKIQSAKKEHIVETELEKYSREMLSESGLMNIEYVPEFNFCSKKHYRRQKYVVDNEWVVFKLDSVVHIDGLEYEYVGYSTEDDVKYFSFNTLMQYKQEGKK